MAHYFANTLDKSHDFSGEYLCQFDPSAIIYRATWDDSIDLSQYIQQFVCILTGAADGVADVTLPISSFQCRYRNDDPTYLSVVVPGIAYSTHISARPNGELVIYGRLVKNGSVYLQAEIVRVDLESIRFDRGGKSKSISLSGHKTTAWVNQSITLTEHTYYSETNGKRTYRFAKPHMGLRPNDTLVVGTDSMVVGMISYAVSPKSQSMEVTEVDA